MSDKKKNIARRLNQQTGLGVTWSDNFRMQDGLIANRGQVVVHEIGLSCTCRSGNWGEDVVGGSGKFSCSNCENGILYRKPLQIMGLISSISSNRQLIETGFINPGDCVLSVSPNLKNPPSDFDKITFTWPENVGDGQVIIRGESIDAMLGLKENEDFLHYQGAEAIYCEDENGKEYHENVDFYFKEKKIVWTNPPALRTRYTIKYKAYLEWLVYDSPMSRRDQDRDLGFRVVLRKKHLVNLRDSVDDSPLDKAQFRSRVRA
tara:strand:+ start:2549 stop:3334 length:786 start_codon:yes stop_codon:yes gene_type:complete